MKNFKTTIAGLLVGLPTLIDALLTAYNSGSFDGKSSIQVGGAIALILIGWMLNDPKKNSNNDAQGILGTDRPNDR